MLITLALPFLLANAPMCRAIDGDTLKCGAEHIRLIGIDAPEMPGHCARYRRCAPGNGWESKAAMVALLRGRSVRLQRFGRDHYGRTLAIAYAGGVNLACAQLASGNAIYKPNWDAQGRIGRACGL